MRLRVTRAAPLAEGIHGFEFRHPGGDELPEFTAGAHVSVTIPGGPIRKYSLCNDPAERDRYAIAVKGEPQGRGGSMGMIGKVGVGDEIEVSDPVNNFALSERAPSYIFIAGGIGITPIMSMIRHLKSSGGKPFRLYYCTRSPQETAFAEELAAAPGGAVTIHHDGGDPGKALDLWPVLEQPKGHVYCCGPRGLMEAVRDMTGHWSPAAIHFEAFTEPEKNRADDKPFTVRLARSGGAAIEVPVGTTILEALRAAGHEAPSSCESGTCGTCKTRLVAGRADHRDLVLTEEEREAHIMICVSRALTPELTIDR